MHDSVRSLRYSFIRVICLRARRGGCVERLHERFNHHGGLLQCVVPSSPSEPDDTLPGGDVLRVVEVQSVQASTARLPPPAALSWCDEKKRKETKFHYHLSLGGLTHGSMTYLEHASAIQRASVIISIIRREWTVVGAIPRVVERVASVSFVTVNLKLVVVGFGMYFEVRILRVSVIISVDC